MYFCLHVVTWSGREILRCRSSLQHVALFWLYQKWQKKSSFLSSGLYGQIYSNWPSFMKNLWYQNHEFWTYERNVTLCYLKTIAVIHILSSLLVLDNMEGLFKLTQFYERNIHCTTWQLMICHTYSHTLSSIMQSK